MNTDAYTSLALHYTNIMDNGTDALCRAIRARANERHYYGLAVPRLAVLWGELKTKLERVFFIKKYGLSIQMMLNRVTVQTCDRRYKSDKLLAVHYATLFQLSYAIVREQTCDLQLTEFLTDKMDGTWKLPMNY